MPHRSTPYRLAKLTVISFGLAFFIFWGVAAWLLVEGHPYNQVAGCLSIDGSGLFWECNSGVWQALGAMAVNGVMVLTLATPVFAMAAIIDQTFLQVAVPGVVFNVIGLPAALFLYIRGMANMFSFIKRRL